MLEAAVCACFEMGQRVRGGFDGLLECPGLLLLQLSTLPYGNLTLAYVDTYHPISFHVFLCTLGCVGPIMSMDIQNFSNLANNMHSCIATVKAEENF